jgi:hypothetical protein
VIGSDIATSGIRFFTNWQYELITYAFIIFLDITLLVPICIEVKRIEVWDDELVLQTMFWTSNLKWQNIVSVTAPNYLSVAVLKTRQSCYLIHRMNLPGFDQFLAKVKEKLT